MHNTTALTAYQQTPIYFGDTPLAVRAGPATSPDATLVYAEGPERRTTHQVVHDGPRMHVEQLDLAQEARYIL